MHGNSILWGCRDANHGAGMGKGNPDGRSTDWRDTKQAGREEIAVEHGQGPWVGELDSMIEFASGGIVSKTVIDEPAAKVVLFTLAAGQSLSEHTASMPASIHVLQGRASVLLGEKRHHARPGTYNLYARPFETRPGSRARYGLPAGLVSGRRRGYHLRRFRRLVAAAESRIGQADIAFSASRAPVGVFTHLLVSPCLVGRVAPPSACRCTACLRRPA